MIATKKMIIYYEPLFAMATLISSFNPVPLYNIFVNYYIAVYELLYRTRSKVEIYSVTRKCIVILFHKHDCHS